MTVCVSRRFISSSKSFSKYAAIALLLAFHLGGCAPPPQPLRVGVTVWPGYEPLFLAQSLGYYEGHPIQLITFPSASEVTRAYRNRAIDVAALTADEVLQISETLADQRIILVCDTSNGADAVLAKPQFQTMQDLRGKRVGFEDNALGAYMLARALAKSGMTAEDVIAIPVVLEEHEHAYASGLVDAVVTFEPRRARLLTAGAHIVFDSSQIPGEIVDVLLAPPELVEADDARLAALINGWFRALDYLEQQPQDAAQRIAPREQITPDDFLASLQFIELPDRAENLRLLGDSEDNLSATLLRLQEAMIANKLLSNADEIKLVLDDRFIREGMP